MCKIDLTWLLGLGLIVGGVTVGFMFKNEPMVEEAWYAAPQVDTQVDSTSTETEWMRYIHVEHYEGRGILEARLWDRSRVDLLTDETAIEADWTYKWEEAIGQSLHYAKRTGRKPVVLLLVKSGFQDSEIMDIMRCQTALDYIGSLDRPKLIIYDCRNKRWAHEKVEWTVE